MRLFHTIFYHFLRFLIQPYFYLVKQYRWKVYKPQSKNYLVLTNHTTNYDFFLFGLCFRKHMYFVCSEHIIRSKAGRLVRFLADPIPRKKGASAEDTVNRIIERLKNGDNVCMMVEGNRSYSGESGWVSPNNVELIRRSEAGLITFGVHGGYFVNPRWSKRQRIGKMWGSVVREYTPDQLSSMSDEEILACIRNDTYVNAYDDQRIHRNAYQSGKPAETLETALFLCPGCHKIGTLRSKKDRLYCSSCELDIKLNKYYYFEGKGEKQPPFPDILSWSKWQTEYLKINLDKVVGEGDELFHDDNIWFEQINLPDEKPENGSIALYKSHLTVACGENEYSFPIQDISRFSIVTLDTILFTFGEGYYQITSKKPYCALKYLICWRFLNGKEYY